ncbi:MAG TPA: hypothetical protein VN783_13465, partial [Thermoanaerobaculia bacterium]|nr:hypothetical protein [Thermoanaerobaculia bacterium]
SGQEIVLVWERIKDLVPISRANNKGPHLFRNLETVANDFIAYWEEHSPGFYKNFSERVRTLPLPKPEPAPTETA